MIKITIENLRYIVKEKSLKRLDKKDVNESNVLDMQTANVLLTVYDQLVKEKNIAMVERFERLMNKNLHGLVSACWSLVK